MASVIEKMALPLNVPLNVQMDTKNGGRMERK
jgi:hypothetical protein